MKILNVASALLLVSASLASPAVSESRKDISIAAPWEVTSYDTAVSGFAFQRLGVMENLVDADANGKLLPALATDWISNEDGTQWTFKIREDVSFHDGSEFNAITAAKALNEALVKPGILKKAPITKIYEKNGSVVVKLERQFAALPSILAHYTAIIPAPASFDGEGAPVAAIGTGPFIVGTFTPPQGMTLKRNEAYWGEAPKLEEASYLAAGRAETRTLLAESGDADLVFTLDPSGFAHLADVDSVETQAVPIPRVVTLKVNAGHKFLSDVRARQALSMAIDRKGIATAITRFPEAAATQLFPPALGKWHSDNISNLETNVEQARENLAALGWVVANDGVLERDGERFSILLRTFPDRPELPLIAAVLQDQWKSIGVELEVSVANYSEIPAGHKDGTLHVALYARNYGLTPDPIGTIASDFGPGGAEWGAMGYENATVVERLNKIVATPNVATKTEDIEAVVKLLNTELPIIPIVWYQHTVSVAKGLEGFVVDPLERDYGLAKIRWAE